MVPAGLRVVAAVSVCSVDAVVSARATAASSDGFDRWRVDRGCADLDSQRVGGGALDLLDRADVRASGDVVGESPFG